MKLQVDDGRIRGNTEVMEILRRKRSYCSVNWETLDKNCRICDNSLEEKYKLIFYFAILIFYFSIGVQAYVFVKNTVKLQYLF